MRKLLLVTSMLLLLLCSCSNKSNSLSKDNNYFIDNYSIDETSMNITNLNEKEIFNLDTIVDNDKFLIIVLKKDCNASKDFIKSFISNYNEENYDFNQLFVFEADKLLDNEQKTEFFKRYNTNVAPTTLLFSQNKLYATEIGSYSEEIMKEILNEFNNL